MNKLFLQTLGIFFTLTITIVSSDAASPELNETVKPVTPSTEGYFVGGCTGDAPGTGPHCSGNDQSMVQMCQEMQCRYSQNKMVKVIQVF